MFTIIDKERHRFVADFETREEAEARLAELLKEDPNAEGLLFILNSGEGTPEGERS